MSLFVGWQHRPLCLLYWEWLSNGGDYDLRSFTERKELRVLGTIVFSTAPLFSILAISFTEASRPVLSRSR